MVAGALVAWWHERAISLGNAWFGRGQTELFAEFERDLPLLEALIIDVRPAPDDDTDLTILDIVARLWPYWSATGRGTQARNLLTEFLERTDRSRSTDATAARFRADWALAWFALSDSDLVAASTAISDAEAVAGPWRTAAQDASIDQLTGILDLYRGDAMSAVSRLQNALAHDIDVARDDTVYIDLSFLGAAASMAHDQESAYDYCERAIALCDRRGERWLRSYVVWAFALSAWRQGEFRRAFALAVDGLGAAAEFSDGFAATVCAEILGWFECTRGDARGGAYMLGIAAAIRAQAGIPDDFWGIDVHRDEASAAGIHRVGAAVFQRGVHDGLLTQSGNPQTWTAVVRSLIAEQQAARLLSPRQREIAELIANGHTNKEIARLLLITVSTVETHIEHIFEKLGVNSRARVAVWVARAIPTASPVEQRA